MHSAVLEASGTRAVVVGGNANVIQTGDGARVVQLPPEAFRQMAEVAAPPGIDDLPARPGHFVGRSAELAELDDALTGSGPGVHVVHGLGGVGKSALVAQWAATRPHGCVPIVWITADTDAAVERGLAGFATSLQPVLAQVLEVAQLAQRALQWLATHTGWLLILDNVDNYAGVAEVCSRAGAGHIVITSRRSTGWPSSAELVRLGVLEPAESLRLLTAILAAAGSCDIDGGAELCETLGHLPLAIEQAGAYLAQDVLLTPRAYSDLLATYPAHLYERGAIGTDPRRTIARIWQVSVERIAATDPSASDLLRVLAWYAPDAIPFTLIQHLAAPPTVATGLGILAAYSMITPDPATATVSMHRLVQAVTRTPDPGDPHRSPEAIDLARDTAGQGLLELLVDREDPPSWPTWRALLPHAEAFVEHAAVDTDVVAVVLNKIGLFLNDHGRPERAVEYLRRALTVFEQLDGPDDPGTLMVRNNLAYAYETGEHLRDAETLYEHVVADAVEILGVDDDATMRFRHSLARTIAKAGRVHEAIALYERNLADRERVLGVDHRLTLVSRSGLARAYDSIGRFADGIELWERTVADAERVLGADHPDTLSICGSLASAYSSIGRTADAIELQKRTVADAERVLGVDYPETLVTRGNLASFYEKADRFDEAVVLYERTVADAERVLGADHPQTLAIRRNLAAAYVDTGRLDEATTLFEQTLADTERILGADHPLTLATRAGMASAYMESGRFDLAFQAQERAAADADRVLGSDHPQTLLYRQNLAGAYIFTSGLDEAIPLLERSVADTARVLGADHPHTRSAISNLIGAYEWYVDAVKEALGPEHPDVQTLQYQLAQWRDHTAPEKGS